MDVANTIVNFDEKVIPIMEPTLHTTWAFGPVLENQMQKIKHSGITIPFNACSVRHRALTDMTEQTIEILQGPLPEYIAFFLMEPLRFEGDLKLSSTKMETHSLSEFSLLLDNVVQENYPLKVIKHDDNKFYHEFYRRWLLETDRYRDTDSQIMSEDEYITQNFIILERFRDFENQAGYLSVKLKFDEELKNKLYLCWMPCYKKRINFDKHLSVQVT